MTPSLTDLETLHRAHSYGWPFETFDVFLSGRNGLDRPSLQTKLGSKTRGGWCFELNEWLALALEDAGFSVRRLMARNTYVPGRPRTHQITLVQIGTQAWIADAGFGAQTPREPMLLEPGYERVQDGLPYRTDHRPGGPGFAEPEHWVLQTRSESRWRDLYRFTLESATAADFEVANHYHLTNPASSFADARVVTRPVPGGRMTLVDHTLKSWRTTRDGEVLEDQQEVPHRAAYEKLLGDTFGIQLPGADLDRLWALGPAVSRVQNSR